MTLIVDSNEVKNGITNLIAPVVPHQVEALNANGFADYRWLKIDGKWKNVERKTWGEILANTDKVEEQLYRHLDKLSSDGEVVFLVEGVAKNEPDGTTLMQPVKNGMYVRGYRSKVRLSGIYSWLYEVGKYCEVIYTAGLNETAIALCAMYKADQKDEHNTFKRHIKQLEFHSDPRVTTLMGVSPGLGNKRASALIERFGTPWNVISAGYKGEPAVKSVAELTAVDGIGPTIVRNILRAFGRPDV